MAKREAQARSLAPAPDSVERAQEALAERVSAFLQASAALRAEIGSFETALASRQPAEPELKLVVSRETAEVEALAAADAVPQPDAMSTRNPARERLYADIGGSVIGLSAATAVINFILLK